MSVKPDVLALRKHGPVLGTRAKGAEAASALRDSDANAPALVLDFAGVEVASSPFLDELACAVRAQIADHPDRFVVVANLNEDVADTLQLVVERRDMSLTVLKGRRLEILGGRQHLDETLAAARELGQFTAGQLAERLAVKVPNLHQRLNQLQAAGAVTRSEDPSAPRGRRMLFATADTDELADALC